MFAVLADYFCLWHKRKYSLWTAFDNEYMQQLNQYWKYINPLVCFAWVMVSSGWFWFRLISDIFYIFGAQNINLFLCSTLTKATSSWNRNYLYFKNIKTLPKILPEVDKFYLQVRFVRGRYNSICSRIKYIQLLKRAEN